MRDSILAGKFSDQQSVHRIADRYFIFRAKLSCRFVGLIAEVEGDIRSGSSCSWSGHTCYLMRIK